MKCLMSVMAALAAALVPATATAYDSRDPNLARSGSEDDVEWATPPLHDAAQTVLDATKAVKRINGPSPEALDLMTPPAYGHVDPLREPEILPPAESVASTSDGKPVSNSSSKPRSSKGAD